MHVNSFHDKVMHVCVSIDCFTITITFAGTITTEWKLSFGLRKIQNEKYLLHELMYGCRAIATSEKTEIQAGRRMHLIHLSITLAPSQRLSILEE